MCNKDVFPIRLDNILLGALITLPFLLPMLYAEVFLDPSEVPESSRRVMVNAALLRAYIHLLLDHLLVVPLLQLPWQVVPSPVKLHTAEQTAVSMQDCSHSELRGGAVQLARPQQQRRHIFQGRACRQPTKPTKLAECTSRKLSSAVSPCLGLS
nr:hypothetical protein BHM03_00029805 [Ipomoea trifida]